jgi:hypothetical protein
MRTDRQTDMTKLSLLAIFQTRLEMVKALIAYPFKE